MGEAEKEFNVVCLEVRKEIKATAARVKDMVEGIKPLDFEDDEKRDKGEMIANLMLTYRHLEDASMRLGKAIQAYDGGVSCYDKESTVGA